MLKTGAMGALGGGAAYAANKYTLSKIMTDASGNDTSANAALFRSGIRMAIGAAVAGFFPGMLGAAFNGGMGYGVLKDLDGWWANRQAQTQAANSAPVQGVDAELNDVLDSDFESY